MLFPSQVKSCMSFILLLQSRLLECHKRKLPGFKNNSGICFAVSFWGGRGGSPMSLWRQMLQEKTELGSHDAINRLHLEGGCDHLYFVYIPCQKIWANDVLSCPLCFQESAQSLVLTNATWINFEAQYSLECRGSFFVFLVIRHDSYGCRSLWALIFEAGSYCSSFGSCVLTSK